MRQSGIGTGEDPFMEELSRSMAESLLDFNLSQSDHSGQSSELRLIDPNEVQFGLGYDPSIFSWEDDGDSKVKLGS